MLSLILKELHFLPLIYGVILLSVIAAGVIARLFAQHLIEVVPDKLGRFLSISFDIHTSGELFVENFLDNAIFDTLKHELFLGRGEFNTSSRIVKCLCKQRDGVISIREQLFEGKYWSGTEPKFFSMGLI